jgi:hypothetical protein
MQIILALTVLAASTNAAFVAGTFDRVEDGSCFGTTTTNGNCAKAW